MPEEDKTTTTVDGSSSEQKSIEPATQSEVKVNVKSNQISQEVPRVATTTTELSQTNLKPMLEESTEGRRIVRKDLFDSDGLVTREDQVQKRVQEIVSAQHREMQSLRRDLYFARLALSRQQQSGANGAQGHNGGLTNGDHLESLMVALGQGNGDYEDSSGMHTGSTASDVSSWEAVDEREAKPTLWMPDHAQPACMK